MDGKIEKKIKWKIKGIKMVKNDRKKSMKEGNERWGRRIRIMILLKSVRGMVWKKKIKDKMIDKIKKKLKVEIVKKRRVNMDEIEKRIVIIRRKGEVMRSRIEGGEVIVIFKEVDLIGGRNMKKMNERESIEGDE